MTSANSRIPDSMLITNSLADLQSSFAKLTDLQDQASSLKRLRKPSDAPADVVSAMSLHAGLNRNAQYATNLSDASAWLGAADNALTSVVTQMQRVNDLVVQASNASMDANGRAGIAAEIDQIKGTLIGLANTQYAGRPIFAGTAGGTAAYDQNGNYVGICRRSSATSARARRSRSTSTPRRPSERPRTTSSRRSGRFRTRSRTTRPSSGRFRRTSRARRRTSRTSSQRSALDSSEFRPSRAKTPPTT